ncbi:MAG: hypothetical protein AB1752_08385 [Candidatus Zixiibacteriota bacterium]
MRLLSIMGIVGGFALYFASIAGWESPILLGVSVPMIVGCAAVLAVLGTRPATKAHRRELVHPVLLALPLDDAPVLTELNPADFTEVVDLADMADQRPTR